MKISIITDHYSSKVKNMEIPLACPNIGEEEARAVYDVVKSGFLNEGKKVEFPDMSKIKNVTFGKRSGVMIFGMKGTKND